MAAAPETYRPRWIGRLNRKLRQDWEAGRSPPPPLDPEALIAKARRRTGLDDPGPERVWRASLEILCGDIESEARLHPIGRMIAHGQLVALLANRLRLHALWRQRPEILERPVAAPIVILGHMRSGTTRMQRLLACDRRLAHTRFFESWNPVPRSRWWDDRRLRGWLALRSAHALNPRFAAIHPTATAAPDEEIGWHSIALFGSALEAQWRVPAFARHCEAMDPAPVYREFRAILQTVAWLRREDPRRPWILKVPQFTQDLPALIAAFPNARLICLRRDPETVVASSASLAFNQMALQSDAADPHWVGREWLRKTLLRQRRLDAARGAASQPQIDVDYAIMSADWRPEIERVYRTLGMDLPPLVRHRMQAFSARPRPSGHRYSLDQFGLSASEVRAALAEEAPLSAAA